MKVLLAGYNIDKDIIDELKEKSGWKEDNISPETLSAAYARISRDSRDISELRKLSRTDVEKSRKSNKLIIFGLGHSSVAEHAYFNFDIIGLSRLAVEYVQKFRLASFTEKSQRYITLSDDFVIPEEIKNSEFKDDYIKLINLQNNGYNYLYGKLKTHLFDLHADDIKNIKRHKTTVDGWAKEDARYIVSMATESQFGMSVNARTLENMLRQFNSAPLKEVRDLSKRLFDLVKDISPSIIKYVEPKDYDTVNPKNLMDFLTNKLDIQIYDTVKINKSTSTVKLLDHTQNPDDFLCAILISAITNKDMLESQEIVKSRLSSEDKQEIFKKALDKRELYDTVSRSFEFVDFTFEMIVSSSNYAQLKRHRISSQLVEKYNPNLGVTIPENVVTIGEKEKFFDIISKTDELFNKMNKKLPIISDYILTNSHRRKVIFKANLRELYHFISLREDAHAQWDIRNSSIEIKEILKKVAPLSTIMLCGKSGFEDRRKEVFGNRF